MLARWGYRTRRQVLLGWLALSLGACVVDPSKIIETVILLSADSRPPQEGVNWRHFCLVAEWNGA